MSAAVVPLIRNADRPSGPAAYARAVRKYNLETSVFIGYNGIVYKRNAIAKDAHKKKHHGHFHLRDLVAAAKDRPSRDSVIEVDIRDIGDVDYVVPVTIGNPGVTVNLQFDTGSSDLWVWSSELPPGLAKKGHHTVYDPAKSKTSKRIEGLTWKIKYGDGSGASGDVWSDIVKIGSLEIPKQAIELANQVSTAFVTERDNGLLGLAWPSINTVKPTSAPTVVANLIYQGIAPGVFSAALDQRDDHGFYTFGGIDAAKAGVEESSIKYTTVDNSKGFWMVDSETAVINGKTVTQKGNQAILDTGTTLCLLSEELVTEIYNTISGAKLSQEAGGWVYPKDAKLPEVKLIIGEDLFILNVTDFTLGDNGDGTLFGGIQSRGNNPVDIFGDIFLKSVYVVFDQEQCRVGVAQRTGNVKP